MAVVQKNSYIPNQDLNNLANNVDYNRLGIDQTNITINFGTTPATVTVKVGSAIEANGNRYEVETSDYVFQIVGASDNYLTFSETGPAFSSSSSKGSYNDSKTGVYQVDNITKTIRWYVDQVEETYDIDDSLQSYNKGDLKTEVNSHKYDIITTGILLRSLSRVGPFVGSYDDFSDPFIIKKPIECIAEIYFNSIFNTPGSADGAIFEIEYFYQGAWTNTGYCLNFLCSTLIYGAFFVATCYVPIQLGPGYYRIRVRESAANYGAIQIHGFDLYIVGSYGQTNLDAPSVYELL